LSDHEGGEKLAFCREKEQEEEDKEEEKKHKELGGGGGGGGRRGGGQQMQGNLKIHGDEVWQGCQRKKPNQEGLCNHLKIQSFP
jgi:hypothetical protein